MRQTFVLAALAISAPAHAAEPASFVLGLHAGPSFAIAPFDITVLPRLTVGVELPFAQRRFRLWGGAGWAPPHASGSADDARVPGGSFDYELTQQELLLGGGVAFAITNPEGPVCLDVELGPQAFLLESRVDGSAGGESFGEHREVYTRVGLLGGLGVRIDAGPGEIAVQALFAASNLDGRVTGDVSTAQLSPSVGYRFVL